ncbi:MAG: transrane domain containing protein [Thermoleophilia bacterium]|nr:transrane domain containing protein [Thermoleophilia bacterium]
MDKARNIRASWAALAVLLAVGAWLTLTPHASAATVAHGLRATYYNDTAFRQPVLTRVDKRVAFNWKYASPSKKIGGNTFAARWTGSVVAPAKGRYTISVRASDGVRVWIDGKLRIKRWTRATKAKESATTLTLAKGKHAIRIDYFESTGAASAVLYWKGPRIRRQVIPAARLLPAPVRAVRTIPTQRWSDPKTWGGKVPAEGAAVTIPVGKAVLLDQSVSLANLTVNGTLIFARQDLTLESDWIVVRGAFEVGTAADPFTERAVIRLRDRAAGENVLNMGDKVLGVMGGSLELHGAPRVVWTRLAATAARGASQISLVKATGWRPGDKIAIASTDFAHNQDEEVTVTAVAGNVLTLDKPLEHTHFGTLQTLGGQQVDERAEVALLTRNVTFEGEAASSADGFGAQILVLDGASAKVANVELQRVGQAGILRRYPIHFHMLGDQGAGSYLKGSSIHHSNNRCATVHGTNRVVVSGNACYDHLGHGFFLEDGAERDNVIASNLGMGTKKPAEGKRLLGSDARPATFWITNPDNIVRDNVAAGSEGHGFWLAMPEHPTGLFAKMYPAETASTWNRRMALTEFSGNTAHSNGGDGVNFDDGPRPDGTTETTHHHARENPADTKSKSLVTTLSGLASYKNRGHGVWLRGTNHRVTGATLADNAVGATFASYESFLQDSLVVGESANVGTPESWEAKSGGVGLGGRSAPRPWESDFPIRGFEFYDGRVGVERTTFVNFQQWNTPAGARREQSAIGYKLDNDFSVDPKNFATAVSFVNAKQLYLPTPQVGDDGALSSVFLDTDGSVTGGAGRSVMVNNPFLFGSGCAARADWNAQVCTGDYATLMVGAPGNHAALAPAIITRPDGQTQTLMASTSDDADTAESTVLANTAYGVAFNSGTPTKTRFVLANGRDRWVRVAIPRAEGFQVMRYGCKVGQAGSWCSGAAASLAALTAATRPSYWYDNHGDADPVTGTLHLKLTSVDSDWDELTVE